MAKLRVSIFMLLLLAALVTLLFRACCYDWNPHYLGNNELIIDEKLYAPDSSIAVVYYTLDVGARGTRSYKCLLKEKDYDKQLMKFNLPAEIVVLKWVDNKTLSVRYDPNEIFELGGTYSKLDFTKDTLVINDVFIVIKQRVKENRDSVFYENFGKYQEEY